MDNLFRGLSRKEGSRGGQSLFNWDSIKDDRHRERYLGHSLKAPVGRWQKDKDLTWYSNDQGKDGTIKLSKEEQRREEIRQIKQREENALAEAL